MSDVHVRVRVCVCVCVHRWWCTRTTCPGTGGAARTRPRCRQPSTSSSSTRCALGGAADGASRSLSGALWGLRTTQDLVDTELLPCTGPVDVRPISNSPVPTRLLLLAQVVLFLEELASVVLTPFMLYFTLPQCAGAPSSPRARTPPSTLGGGWVRTQSERAHVRAVMPLTWCALGTRVRFAALAEDIVQFVSEFTVHVEGVGDVCSLACFDLKVRERLAEEADTDRHPAQRAASRVPGKGKGGEGPWACRRTAPIPAKPSPHARRRTATPSTARRRCRAGPCARRCGAARASWKSRCSPSWPPTPPGSQGRTVRAGMGGALWDQTQVRVAAST